MTGHLWPWLLSQVRERTEHASNILAFQCTASGVSFCLIFHRVLMKPAYLGAWGQLKTKKRVWTSLLPLAWSARLRESAKPETPPPGGKEGGWSVPSTSQAFRILPEGLVSISSHIALMEPEQFRHSVAVKKKGKEAGTCCNQNSSVRLREGAELKDFSTENEGDEWSVSPTS